jgi:hypothetical protein
VGYGRYGIKVGGIEGKREGKEVMVELREK